MNIELTNFDEVFDRVERTFDRTADLRETGPEIDRAFTRLESEQFATEGAAGRGGRWAPLTRSTEAQKRGRGSILVRTGRLRDSLTRTGHAEHVYRASEDELELGTSVPYAGRHQRGGRKLPQREVIALTPEQAARLFEPVVRRAREEVGRLQ